VSDQALREYLPEVDWDTPIRVSVAGVADRWVCRYCIAQRGLKAESITMTPFAFTSFDDCVAHITRKHS
jgi:hypothetical protein